MSRKHRDELEFYQCELMYRDEEIQQLKDELKDLKELLNKKQLDFHQMQKRAFKSERTLEEYREDQYKINHELSDKLALAINDVEDQKLLVKEYERIVGQAIGGNTNA